MRRNKNLLFYKIVNVKYIFKADYFRICDSIISDIYRIAFKKFSKVSDAVAISVAMALFYY